jgi:hypothetical protein
MTAPSSAPLVARLSTPGEIASVVPVLCGFVPHESLVVVSLKERRSRVGLTMRVDLPPPELVPDLVVDLVARLRFDGARRVVIAVYTDEPDAGGLPQTDLVRQLTDALGTATVPVTESLLVRHGRWWSYACDVPSCCPPEGTPLEVEQSPSVGLVAAQHAWEGRAVLPSRADLVASLSPPTHPSLSQRLDAAERTRLERVRTEGRVTVGRDALRLWRRVMDQLPEGGPPAPDTAAALVVSLTDVLVRDELLTWSLQEEDSLLALLLHLAAQSPQPYDVPVCSLIGWTAHVRGDGGLANVALDRALVGDPGYGLARLSRQALDSQVPPASVRSLLRDARAVLRQQHPWTGCHEA